MNLNYEIFIYDKLYKLLETTLENCERLYVWKLQVYIMAHF